MRLKLFPPRLPKKIPEQATFHTIGILASLEGVFIVVFCYLWVLELSMLMAMLLFLLLDENGGVDDVVVDFVVSDDAYVFVISLLFLVMLLCCDDDADIKDV